MAREWGNAGYGDEWVSEYATEARIAHVAPAGAHAGLANICRRGVGTAGRASAGGRGASCWRVGPQVTPENAI